MFTRIMDYLDSKKEFRHHITLMVGYVLVALAIVMATVILLHQAYGFGLAKNGDVIQNGLTFFSSQPSPANIYINGKKQPVSTNTRLGLPAGIYDVKLTRDGYRDWRRSINLEGGSVKHYDYPFLIPKKLVTRKVQTFPTAPGMMTQSPDRRWLLIHPSGEMTNIILYDLKNPDKPATELILPSGVLTPASVNESWQLSEWSSDNQHVLLQHNYDGKSEFVVVDRLNPEESLNINNTLSVVPSKLTLRDKKHDKYYIHDQASGSLLTASLANPVPVEAIQKVIAYKSYGNDTILYITAHQAPQARALVKMLNLRNKKTITVRSLPAAETYVLDLTRYSDEMYVAAGATTDSRVYVFKDPVRQKVIQPEQAPAPEQVLHVVNPNYLSFSTSAQFIMAQTGNRFGVYDSENEVGFNYSTLPAIDLPQTHASWMDGNRLVYASGGQLLMLDYDNQNTQTLMPISPGFLPAFTPDYDQVYALAPGDLAGQVELTVTDLLTPSDQ